MVKHIVMWKLKDEAEGHTKQENADKIKKLLLSLPAVIPEIEELTVGINENGGEYDVILLSAFSSYDALKTYDAHPEHQKVRAFVRAVVLSRAAFDFTV